MQEQNGNIQGEQPEEVRLTPEEEALLKKMAGFGPEDYAEMNRLMKARAEQVLQEKYGESFTAAMIGDRFNRGRAKVYLHPDGEEALVFTALVYFDGTVKDDYPAGRLLFRTEREIQERLSAAGLTAAANCAFPGILMEEADVSLSLKDFAEKHHLSRILCRLIFPEGTEEEAILPVMEQFSAGFPMEMMINVFILGREAFEQCGRDFAAYPSVSEDMIRGYEPAGFFRLFVSGGKGMRLSE